MNLPFLLLLFGLLVSNVCKTQILKVPVACTGLTCENDGTLSTVGDECSCMCQESYTGLQCQTEVEESNWPAGPYATPMPIYMYGCPEQEGKGWMTGYINMTFKDKAVDSRIAKNLTLLGPFDDRVIQMNFCYKTPGNGSQAQWPPGRYSIYRAGGTCPQGFGDQVLQLKLPALRHVNTDGNVPDVVLTEMKVSSILRISLCERRIPQTWDFPFILLARSKHKDTPMTCPKFAGIDVLLQTLELQPITSSRSGTTTMYRENN